MYLQRVTCRVARAVPDCHVAPHPLLGAKEPLPAGHVPLWYGDAGFCYDHSTEQGEAVEEAAE